ncbi:hypothetical protein [Corticimicrobacter populi]|uniref:Argininosuccinate lyase n=1 Tax=Corticimicrobacter populi TaxID=2175229 RepID=A0A2V1JZ26_9BURK|nr:hypothetical protein [Corticimicrobacter populi]PWF24049.1 hypothetical protein DD235_06935 [Corticimicrobacter populi]QDQ88103.1 hypothetical protein FMZ60_11260 [Alcaligenaceae bacterium SJ-26]
MPIKSRLLLLATVAAGLFAATGPASAADRNVTVHNKTQSVLISFYASRTSTSDWEEDILGSEVIGPGESIKIDIDDGTGACRFDFKGTFDDGEEATRNNVNVCEVAEFSFTD